MLKRLSAVLVGVLLVTTTPTQAKESLVKMNVTCYTEQGPAFSGSERIEKVIASRKEWLGCVANVWTVSNNGQPGEFLGTYEFLDIGYGHPLENSGTSSDLKGYEGEPAGTVETGLTLDFRQPNSAACVEFMEKTRTGSGLTGSEVIVQLIRGKG